MLIFDQYEAQLNSLNFRCNPPVPYFVEISSEVSEMKMRKVRHDLHIMHLFYAKNTSVCNLQISWNDLVR
jgi:hypothetical protein